MAILSTTDQAMRRLGWLLVVVSLAPFVWIVLAVKIPGLTFEVITTGFIVSGLFSLGSIIWLVVLVVKLTKRRASGAEDRKTVVKACLIFGQFGALWSIYFLTSNPSQSATTT